MVKQKSVAIVSGSGDTFVWFRIELLKRFQEKGFKVYGFAPEISRESKEILRQEGIIFIQTSLSRKNFNVFNLCFGILELKTHFNTIKPDVLISYMHKSIIASSFAIKLTNKSTRIFSIVSGLGHLFERQDIKHSLFKAISSLLLKLAFKRNESVFFQNPDDLNLFIKSKIIEKNKSYIMNGSGVDLDKFSLQRLPNAPIFMTMARLLRSKGLIEFAKAASIVKSEYPHSKFLIYGYPDDHSDSIDENEIKNSWTTKYGIDYLGYTDQPSEALGKCSVFVLLSYREGTPRTVLEAMSKGRPIITTNAPGCRETVKHLTNGFIVEVGDHVAAAEAMKKLCSEQLRCSMGAESRRLAEEKYDVHEVNKKILNLILDH